MSEGDGRRAILDGATLAESTGATGATVAATTGETENAV
jgi:hypothetical protein